MYFNLDVPKIRGSPTNNTNKEVALLGRMEELPDCYRTGLPHDKEHGEDQILMVRDDPQDFNYPPVFVQPPPIQAKPAKLPNQFLYRVYQKYPSELRKELRDRPHEIIQENYNRKHGLISSYQRDFCGKGEMVVPMLERAPGVFKREKDPPTFRLPGDPYMPGTRDPISKTIFIPIKPEPKIEPPPTYSKFFSVVTEYSDNVGGLGSFIIKNNLHGQKTYPVLVPRTKII